MVMGSSVIPTLRYKDAPAAMEWLEKALGFKQNLVIPNPDGTIAHAQLTLGSGMVMLGSQREDAYESGYKSPGELGGKETANIYVVVEDADAAYAQAKASGATMMGEVYDTDYGSREFQIKDPEGHTWCVGTYDPWKPHP